MSRTSITEHPIQMALVDLGKPPGVGKLEWGWGGEGMGRGWGGGEVSLQATWGQGGQDRTTQEEGFQVSKRELARGISKGILARGC